VNTIEDDYLPFDPFYGQASTADLEPAPLPLDLERELEEGMYYAAITIRDRPL